MNQAPAFWGFTLRALREARILCLCRIYDQHTSSLNLTNLLGTIRDNRHLFETDAFKDRLQDNPHVDGLASHSRLPDLAQLEKDTAYARPHNPVIKKLVIWRNNFVAHRSAKLSLGRNTILKENAISKEEFDELTKTALNIHNRYSSLFKASTWSQQLIGQDDYKSCLALIRLGLQKDLEDIGES